MNAPLTLKLPPQSADKLVARVGVAVGIPLQTAGKVSDDILALHAENVSAAEVLERLEWVTQGHWIDRDGIRTLVRVGEASPTPRLIDPNAVASLDRLDTASILNFLPRWDLRFPAVRETPPESFVSWLRDPVCFDPLSIGMPEALEFAAKRAERAVIANLDDSTFDEVFMVAEGDWNEDASPRHLFGHFEQPGTYELRESERWLAIRPLNIEQTVSSRLNRNALRHLLQALLERGWARFGEFATIAAAVEDMPATIFGLAVLTGQKIPWSLTSWRMVQLLGLFTPDQRGRLSDGEILLDDDLPADLLARVNWIREQYCTSDIEAIYERELLPIKGIQFQEGEEKVFDLINPQSGGIYGRACPERRLSRIIAGAVLPPPCGLEETRVQRIGIPELRLNIGATKHGVTVLTLRSRYAIPRSELLKLSDLLPFERSAVEAEYAWLDSFRWDR